MPPKKTDKNVEDFSDVPTLPQLNSAIFTIIYGKFASKEQKDKLQKYITEKLPLNDKIKSVTREELYAYAKLKQIILEEKEMNKLPQDDPRLKMNESDQYSKAATDKLFELSVYARRAKKEKMAKQEEEGKSKDPNFVLDYDHDQLETLFNVVDFPLNKRDVQAFQKLNNSLNIVILVNQAVDETQDQPPLIEEERKRSDLAIERFNQLSEARAASQKGDLVRNSVFLNLEFSNQPVVTYRVDEQTEEEIKESREGDEHLLNEIMGCLDQNGQLYVKYLRFKDRVKRVPLAPDMEARRGIEELKNALKANQYWIDSSYLPVVNEPELSQAQKDAMSPEDLQSYVSQRQQILSQMQETKSQVDQQNEDFKKDLDKLSKRLNVSIDDERSNWVFDTATYNASFVPDNKESQNSIASVMSAMISQIADSNSYINEEVQKARKEDQTLESIDDLFADTFSSIQYDMRIENRPDTAGESDRDDDQQQNQVRLFSQKTNRTSTIDNIEYSDDLDGARKHIQRLPESVTDEQEQTAYQVHRREKQIYKYLQIPGKNRYLMPQIPKKSERVRDAEIPCIHPFSTCPVEEIERGQIIKQFIELQKKTNIDGGKIGKEKHHKYRVFDRNFEQYMVPHILAQTLSETMLHDPDFEAGYDERNDNLLLAIYNKYQEKQSPLDFDNQKVWEPNYRVMPDFENFIQFFSALVTVDEITGKLQLDDTKIPESLYDIDDKKIGYIGDRSQFYYPEDNSVMRLDTLDIGGRTTNKNIVLKDNLTFGIRKKVQPKEAPVQTEFGLYTMKTVGDAEVWVQFENETKLLVELQQISANLQKIKKQPEPPKPTPEELAAAEAARLQAIKDAAKVKPGQKQPVNQPPPPEPEPVIKEPEYEDPNVIDQTYQDFELDNVGALSTLTFANGMIVKMLKDGNICQTYDYLQQGQYGKSDEIDRIITKKGSVIRHLVDGNVEILFANGNKSYFNREQRFWILTNSRGIRNARKDGIEWRIQNVPCSTETDLQISYAKTTVREDKVVTVEFKDGTRYVQHSDGTMIQTNAAGDEIRIEKFGYSPTLIKDNHTGGYLDWDSDKDRRKPEDRSIDGIIRETYLPDGTIVVSYDEKWEDDDHVSKYIVKRPDFSLVIIDTKGLVKIISSNARSSLNEEGSKKKIGEDVDWMIELKGKGPSEDNNNFQNGVFYANLYTDENQSSLVTQYTDDSTATSYYRISVDQQMSKASSGSADQNNQSIDLNKSDSFASSIKQKKQKQENAPIPGEVEIIGDRMNSYTKHFQMPRLFIIRPDGSGVELCSHEQLEYDFRQQKTRDDILRIRKHTMIGKTTAKCRYMIAKTITLAQRMLSLNTIRDLPFPQNALYAVQDVLNQFQPFLQNKTHQIPEQYVFRQIFEMPEFDGFKQEAFYEDLVRFQEWKKGQLRYETEFGIQWVDTKEIKYNQVEIADKVLENKRIQLKVLKARNEVREEFNPEASKEKFLKELQKSDQLTEYHKRMTNIGMSESQKNRLLHDESSIEDDKERVLSAGNIIDNLTQENWRQKKQASSEIRLRHFMAEMNKMINTPTFVDNYFKCREGQLFTKNNPAKPASTEVLMRMSQRINRSQSNNNNGENKSQYDGYSSKNEAVNNLNLSGNKQQQDGEGLGGLNAQMEDKDNPIVALEPEEQINKQMMMNSKKLSQMQASAAANQASLFAREKDLLKARDQEHLLKSEEYHVVKTKDFNVYGRLRQDKPFVKTIQKSNAKSELNEKFITTECITDKRIKISSMAGRQYMNAPTVEEVRKQGQHQMILSAINKKQTFSDLINQANSMVTAVLHDPMKKALNVMPSSLVFGRVKQQGKYEMMVTLKNEDSVVHRINIKTEDGSRLKVSQVEYGPIAPGMMKKILVELRMDDYEVDNEQTYKKDFLGHIKEELQIVAKHDIYKIPVTAEVLSFTDYEEAQKESQALKGKSITNSKVRQKLNQSIMDAGKDSQVDGGMDDGGTDGGRAPGGGQKLKNWIETTQSDSKLPVSNQQYGSRPFPIDPKKSLNEIKKGLQQ